MEYVMHGDIGMLDEHEMTARICSTWLLHEPPAHALWSRLHKDHARSTRTNQARLLDGLRASWKDRDVSPNSKDKRMKASWP